MFKRNKYAAAIDRYTEAIMYAPSMHVLFTNRALCHKMLGRWDQCEADSQRALDLGGSLIKANYCLGVALRHKLQYSESALRLERALAAAREKGDSIKDQIWRELAACKYLCWKRDSQRREEQRKRLRERVVMMMNHYHSHRGEDWRHDLQDLDDVLAIAAGVDDVRDTDNAFACLLTMEPFREPVCTPGGQSYERSALMEHLSRGQGFDPVSREALSIKDVVPNYRLRAATQHYLDEHPWAWSECMDVAADRTEQS